MEKVMSIENPVKEVSEEIIKYSEIRLKGKI